MELQVTITFTDRLFALLEDKLPSLGRRVERAVEKEINAVTRGEMGINVSLDGGEATPKGAAGVVGPKGEDGKKYLKELANAAPAEPAPAPAPAPTVTVAVDPAEAEGEGISAMDLRKAMAAVRARIEGDDWQLNAESEGYQRYHDALTELFKSTARLLGGASPVKVPEDKRESFLATLATIGINSDGEVAIIAPF